MTFFFDNFWKREIFTFFHFFYKFWRFRKHKKMTNFQLFGVSPENDKIYPPPDDKKVTSFDRTSKSLPSDPRTTPRKSNFFLFFWKVRDFLFGPMRVGVSVGRTFWMTTSVGCSSIDHGEEFPDPSSFFLDQWRSIGDKVGEDRKILPGKITPPRGVGGSDDRGRSPGDPWLVAKSLRPPSSPATHLILNGNGLRPKAYSHNSCKKNCVVWCPCIIQFFSTLEIKNPSRKRVSKHSTILNFFCSPLEKILLLVSERSQLVTILPHLSSFSCFVFKKVRIAIDLQTQIDKNLQYIYI